MDNEKEKTRKTWVTRPLRPLGEEAAPAFPKTAPAEKTAFPKTMPVREEMFPQTRPLRGMEACSVPPPPAGGAALPPLFGWLVCVQGEKRGQDFRITAEKCYIGRGLSNDIVLDFDGTISRETHLILSFNRMDGSFWLDVSQSRDNVYRGETLVQLPVKLSAREVFAVGRTSLMLIPLCDATFQWE